MTHFRISVGSGFCKDYKGEDRRALACCDRIKAKLNDFKAADPDFLKRFPPSYSEIFEVDGSDVILSVFHEKQEGRSLIIAQTYYQTWKSPNYISFQGVGRVFAEGVSVGPDGQISEATQSDVAVFW